ncbi:MAG: hypothetical protein ABSA05_10960 [Opitutaceae bacterium]
MRAILASAAILIVGAFGMLCWQQSEIASLSAQLNRQSASPQDVRPRPAVAVAAPRGLSADERRFVLDQYRGVLAKMNLPPATSLRLQDLLTERIAAAMDAQDAAARDGFADGSPETARAESAAIARVDEEIAMLIGAEADTRLNWYLAGSPSSPAVAPAAPTIVVNVEAPPPAPVEVDTAEQPADAYVYTQPAPYIYNYGYPYTGYWVGEVYSRPYVRERFGGDRGYRPEPPHPGNGSGGVRLGRRPR